MAPTHNDDPSSLNTLVTGLVVFCLASAVTVVGVRRLVERLEPKVGEILSFEHLGRLGPLLHQKIRALKVGADSAGSCILDVDIMRTSGGSVVIEALQSRTRPMYRVHWAGFRTSTGEADCGVEADLMLSRSQLIRLMSTDELEAPSEKAHSELLSSAATSAIY